MTAQELAERLRQWEDDGACDLPAFFTEEELAEPGLPALLARYQKLCEFQWRQEDTRKLEEIAARLGLEGNLALARAWRALEHRVGRLEEKAAGLS